MDQSEVPGTTLDFYLLTEVKGKSFYESIHKIS